jgi:hypothetical protein
MRWIYRAAIGLTFSATLAMSGCAAGTAASVSAGRTAKTGTAKATSTTKAPSTTKATSTTRATSIAKASGSVQAGTVRLIAYSINSDGPHFHAILTGAIGDYGPAVTVHPDGKIDPEHTSQLELKLRHGTLRLGIATLDRAIVRAYQHWPANPHTCSGTIVVSAEAPVIASDGTGSYRGISGKFLVTATIAEVDTLPCNGTGKFLSQVIMLTATGKVSTGKATP